tara:strand:+ start:320 stop:646 length:327 start_codon:yes stop_codon:yes gene_type:complete
LNDLALLFLAASMATMKALSLRLDLRLDFLATFLDLRTTFLVDLLAFFPLEDLRLRLRLFLDLHINPPDAVSTGPAFSATPPWWGIIYNKVILFFKNINKVIRDMSIK